MTVKLLEYSNQVQQIVSVFLHTILIQFLSVVLTLRILCSIRQIDQVIREHLQIHQRRVFLTR
jgi:hypothetical protein